MPAQIHKHRFTVDEWQRMGVAGVLPADGRMELIEGEVFEMPPIGPAHGGQEKRLIAWFSDHLDSTQAIVSAQDPVRLGDFSEPQPDLALLRPRADFYAKAHPTPDDVLLLIEIADTSLERDRSHKIPLYGRYGVRESWVVNLAERTVEVYTKPAAHGYGSCWVAGEGDVLRPELLPGLAVAVGEVLG
jgi:Uma2 family endonuclease